MNLIDRAAELAKPVSSPATTRESFDTKIERLKRERRGLLPVERDARDAYDTEIATARSGRRFSRILSMLPDVQVLDPEPFTWRNGQGLPLLMPFSLNSAEPAAISSSQENSFSPAFPLSTRRLYKDVADSLNDMFRKDALNGIGRGLLHGFLVGCCIALGLQYLSDWGVEHLWTVMGGIPSLVAIIGSIVVMLSPAIEFRIAASFKGIIPDKTRRKIKAAEGLFDELFVLAETPDLKIEERELPSGSLEGDPLIVGALNGQFFLIDKFDTTTIEQRVADEHCTKP